jgi:hypothetical protein
MWQNGVGGGGALAAALVLPPTLILCLVCVAWLGLSCLACFARLASGLSAYDVCLRPWANIGGGTAVPSREVCRLRGRSHPPLIQSACQSAILSSNAEGKRS